jgi:ribokinase
MENRIQIARSSAHIVTIGYLLTDWLIQVEHLPVTPGDHQTLSHLEIEPGGMSNFLIAGQRLGGEMHALDAIGADRYGQMLLEALAAEGVDTSQVVRVEGAKSRGVAVLSGPDDRHAFMAYPGSELPVQALSAEWMQPLSEADALYVDGFSLRQEHIRGAVEEAARKMHERGGEVFYDPGPTMHASPEFLNSVYGVFLTDEELLGWMGLGGAEGAWSLLEEGPELVVIKGGAAGCTIVTGGHSQVCKGYFVPVKDTLGAGDVFNAAFVLALLQGKSAAECGAYANAAGAAAVQKFGAGRNVPSGEEVEEIVRNQVIKND